MNISTTLSGREAAVVSEIESLGIPAAILLRVALNRLLDELVTGDGAAPSEEDIQEHLLKEYSQLIEKHGGGPGVSLHAIRLENEAMNAYALRAVG